jgi:hypothetical protein
VSVTQSALLALAEKLHDDLEHADRHAQELTALREHIPTGSEVYAVALLLHHLYYGAIEAIIERSLKTFDGVLPAGEQFHVALLEQAAVEVPGLRGPILPKDDAVDELRRFRHRLRKRYDDELDPALLHETLCSALDAWPQIRKHLTDFAVFVDACAAQAP